MTRSSMSCNQSEGRTWSVNLCWLSRHSRSLFSVIVNLCSNKETVCVSTSSCPTICSSVFPSCGGKDCGSNCWVVAGRSFVVRIVGSGSDPIISISKTSTCRGDHPSVIRLSGNHKQPTMNVNFLLIYLQHFHFHCLTQCTSSVY